MADAAFQLYIKLNGEPVPFDGLYKQVDGEGRLVNPAVRVQGDPTPNRFTIANLVAQPQFYVAHRCGGGDWPEFSEAGILGSLARGVKAFELSVYQCASGEFVLSHDWTTERMTGVRHEIWQTPWSVLSTLTSTAADTTDPTQPRQPLLRLTDALELIGPRVVFIDHKATSEGPGNPNDQASMANLLAFMDTIPDGKQRFVWKTFKGGYQGADTARGRGYPAWGIYYSDEITTAPTRLDSFDLIGMTWNAAQSFWDVANATNKPTIAHIVTTVPQRDSAKLKGADGYMNSNPTRMP